MYDYAVDGNVAVLTMGNHENRFNSTSMKAFSDVLSRIEGETQVNALVTVSADEKVWCNGIDLEWLLPEIETQGEQALNRFLVEIYSLFKQLLTMPMITVAAINGHAFAGGAFLAFSHDFRFMRSDCGWLCLPEVDLGIPLGPVFLAICKHVLPMNLFHDMQYTARRLTADECAAYNIITRPCNAETTLNDALDYAHGLNKGRDVIQKMKLETLAPVLHVIDETLEPLT